MIEKVSLLKATEMELRACNVEIEKCQDDYYVQYLYARKSALELQLNTLYFINGMCEND